MTNKKKFTLLFALLSLLFTLNMVESTYAKYVSKTTATSKMNVARWDIKVNGQQIKQNQTLTANLTPEYESNDNVASGVIAPGSIGSVTIEIDPSDTDVSFNYEISAESSDASAIDDLKILKYTIDDDPTEIMLQNGEKSIVGDIINSTKAVRKITIYVIWDDNLETESMNNAQDTSVGHAADIESVYGEIKLSMKFTQIK